MGHHLVSLHSVGPDMLHTIDWTPCPTRGYLLCVAKVNGGQNRVHQRSNLAPPASSVLLPKEVDGIGLCMGQHSNPLYCVGLDLLHTFNRTPCLT